MVAPVAVLVLFFFNDTATTEIYTLSLHDALPIYRGRGLHRARPGGLHRRQPGAEHAPPRHRDRTRDHVRRSEEHTSELQSLAYLVCRLLLEKKKAHPTIRVATSDAHITLARKTTR